MRARPLVRRPVTRRDFKKGYAYIPTPTNQSWQGGNVVLWVQDGKDDTLKTHDGQLMCISAGRLCKDEGWYFGARDTFYEKKNGTVYTSTDFSNFSRKPMEKFSITL